MDPRVRLFVWAGTCLLAAISLQPAGEVLAADLRGSSAEVGSPRAEMVTVERVPQAEERSIEVADKRRS